MVVHDHGFHYDFQRNESIKIEDMNPFQIGNIRSSLKEMTFIFDNLKLGKSHAYLAQGSLNQKNTIKSISIRTFSLIFL